jgi:hypothetical protein
MREASGEQRWLCLKPRTLFPLLAPLVLVEGCVPMCNGVNLQEGYKGSFRVLKPVVVPKMP